MAEDQRLVMKGLEHLQAPLLGRSREIQLSMQGKPTATQAPSKC